MMTDAEAKMVRDQMSRPCADCGKVAVYVSQSLYYLGVKEYVCPKGHYTR